MTVADKMAEAIKQEAESYKYLGICIKQPWYYRFMSKLMKAKYILRKVSEDYAK